MRWMCEGIRGRRGPLADLLRVLDWKPVKLPRALRHQLAWCYGTVDAARLAPDDELAAIGVTPKHRLALRGVMPTPTAKRGPKPKPACAPSMVCSGGSRSTAVDDGDGASSTK